MMIAPRENSSADRADSKERPTPAALRAGVRRELFESLGEQAVQRCEYPLAIALYEIAGNRAALRSIGIRCLVADDTESAIDALVAAHSEESLAHAVETFRLVKDFDSVGYALAATGRLSELLALADERAEIGERELAMRLFALAPISVSELEDHALRLVREGKTRAAAAAEAVAMEDLW